MIFLPPLSVSEINETQSDRLWTWEKNEITNLKAQKAESFTTKNDLHAPGSPFDPPEVLFNALMWRPDEVLRGLVRRVRYVQTML